MGGRIDVVELANGFTHWRLGVATSPATDDGSDQNSGLIQVEGHDEASMYALQASTLAR